MADAQSSGFMIKGPKNDYLGTFPKWPEGFDDVTCPMAVHLCLWLTSNCDRGFWIKADHPHSSITAELFKNHINLNQACLLLEHADLRHPINMQLLDWIAINGGGEETLKHKYKLEKSFQLARESAVDALENYRQHEFYLEKPEPNCNFEPHLEF
jgi:hypothetical protein